MTRPDPPTHRSPTRRRLLLCSLRAGSSSSLASQACGAGWSAWCQSLSCWPQQVRQRVQGPPAAINSSQHGADATSRQQQPTSSQQPAAAASPAPDQNATHLLGSHPVAACCPGRALGLQQKPSTPHTLSTPPCLLLPAGGIGLFLAFIGLQNSEGIGLISYNSATLVTLGGCPLENRVYQFSIANTSTAAVCTNNPDTGLLEAKLGPPSSSYSCAVSAGHT